MKDQSHTFNPMVSIVIPVYNGSNYLDEAINSALRQSYHNIEVLVVNDGSDDNGATEEIALSYGGQIRYFRKNNGGVSTALNHGIRQMKGEYLSWLSHDDIYEPNKISEQVAALSELPRQDSVIYSDCYFFNDKGEFLADYIAENLSVYSIRYWLTVKSVIHGCSLLIPHSCFRDVGLFNESLKTTQDYDMWFRLGGRYQFIYVPGTFVGSRQHPYQDSRKLATILRDECDLLRCKFISQLAKEEFLCHDINAPMLYLDLCRHMLASGYSKAADLSLKLAKQSLEFPVKPSFLYGFLVVSLKIGKIKLLRLARVLKQYIK